MPDYNPWNAPDYLVAVSLGRVTGHTPYLVHGRNADVDVGSEDVWSQGGTWVPPTAARIHAIVSDSANDTGAGTGARTIRVWGVDGAGAEITEDVALGGLAPANTTKSYRYIRKMRALTAGSGGTNAGNITATAAVDVTVSSVIPAGIGESHEATFMVPTGYTALVMGWWVSAQGAAAARVDVALVALPSGGASYEASHLAVQIGGSSIDRYVWSPPVAFPALTILKVRATCDQNNTDVHAGMNILLVSTPA